MNIKKSFSIIFSAVLLTAGAVHAQQTGTVYNVGDIKVVSVQDQPMVMSAEILHAQPDVLKKYLPDGKCEASLNVFLIDNGKDVILVDAGLGGNGKAIENLAKTGYPLEKITGVILTHLHGDHFGGTVKAGVEAADSTARVFKNAKIYVPKTEFDFWVDTKKAANVQRFAKIYGDNVVKYEKGKEPVKGITPIPAYGHTPGHTMYKIASKGQEMLLWGDIIHCLAAQIKDPAITIDYDSDTKQAAKTRADVLKSVSKSKTPVAGAHLPYPGVIVITESGSGYDYKPAK